MRERIARGDVWMHTFAPPDKRRPVVVLTRDSAIGFLHRVLVAPVTSTIRGSPGEVQLGPEAGLKGVSAANLDLIQAVRRQELTRYMGHVGPEKLREICRALAIATGCERPHGSGGQ